MQRSQSGIMLKSAHLEKKKIRVPKTLHGTALCTLRYRQVLILSRKLLHGEEETSQATLFRPRELSRQHVTV